MHVAFCSAPMTSTCWSVTRAGACGGSCAWARGIPWRRSWCSRSCKGCGGSPPGIQLQWTGNWWSSAMRQRAIGGPIVPVPTHSTCLRWFFALDIADRTYVLAYGRMRRFGTATALLADARWHIDCLQDVLDKALATMHQLPYDHFIIHTGILMKQLHSLEFVGIAYGLLHSASTSSFTRRSDGMGKNSQEPGSRCS